MRVTAVVVEPIDAQTTYFVSRDKIDSVIDFPVEGLDMTSRVCGPQGATAWARLCDHSSTRSLWISTRRATRVRLVRGVGAFR